MGHDSLPVNEYLQLYYRGMYSHSIVEASEADQGKWTGNEPLNWPNFRPLSSQTPGVAFFQSKLYMAYKGDESNRIYLAVMDENGWHLNKPIHELTNGKLNPLTTKSPSLIVYNDVLYCFFVGEHQNINVIKNRGISDEDWTFWKGSETKIVVQGNKGETKTDEKIALAVFDNLLYFIYKGQGNNKIYSAFMDPEDNCHGDQAIVIQPGKIITETTKAPAAVAFQDKLYVAYTAKQHPHMILIDFDGNSWRYNDLFNHGAKDTSKGSPSAIVFKESMYLFYVKSDDIFAYHCYDGEAWRRNIRFEGMDPKSYEAPQPVNCKLSFKKNTEWMRYIPNNTLICDIAIPGTHDSAAINSWKTPYATQGLSITKQLEAGIRLLDLRVSIHKTNGQYSFMTCHGNWSLGADVNEYQTLESFLKECVDFLDRYKTEMIAILIKVDDWHGLDHTMDEKKAALAAMASFLDQHCGQKLFKSKDMPKLEQVRGRIYLLTRENDAHELDLGAPVSWGKTPVLLSSEDRRAFEVYVQDEYKGEGYYYNKKWKLFIESFEHKQPGQLLINFASAVEAGLRGVYLNKSYLEYLGAYTNQTRPANIAWSFWDSPDSMYETDKYKFINNIDMVIASNNRYTGYPDKFTVTSWSW